MSEPVVPGEVRVLIWNRQGDEHRVAVTLADDRRGHGDGRTFDDALAVAVFNAEWSDGRL